MRPSPSRCNEQTVHPRCRPASTRVPHRSWPADNTRATQPPVSPTYLGALELQAGEPAAVVELRGIVVEIRAQPDHDAVAEARSPLAPVIVAVRAVELPGIATGPVDDAAGL